MSNEETQIALLNQRFEALETKFDTLQNSVGDLVEAWKTANNLVKFMKWLSGLSVSAAVLYELVKHRI